jgi:hypothetical protein
MAWVIPERAPIVEAEYTIQQAKCPVCENDTLQIHTLRAGHYEMSFEACDPCRRVWHASMSIEQDSPAIHMPKSVDKDLTGNEPMIGGKQAGQTQRKE